MKWVAQVRHVAAKDVRHSRWTLLAYTALILIATLSIVTRRAFGPYSPPSFASSSSPSSSVEVLAMQDTYVMVVPFIVVVLGLVAMASLVQMDSPTRVDAFWASRPLTPSAVFSAKLLAALVVVALALAGSGAALATLDTHGSMLRGTLAHAGLSFGEWALAAIVIGALTDDLRTSLVVLVGILVGMLALSTVLQDVSIDVPVASMSAVVSSVGVIGAVVVVAYLYRTRDRRLRSWVLGLVAAACLIIGSFITPGSSAATVHSVASGPSLTLAPQPLTSWGQGRELPMRIQAAPSAVTGFERLDFKPESVSITLLSGKTVLANAGRMSFVIRANPPALGRPVRWLLVDSGTMQSGFSVEPRDLDRPAIAAGVRSVEVTGAVTVSRSRVIGTLPLTRGATFTRDGRRLTIYGSSHDNTGADVWIQTTSLPRPDAEAATDLRLRQNGGLQFALVNEARGEALLLSSWTGSGGSGSVVLPWIGITTMFNRLTTTTMGASPPAALPRDDAWYAGAHVVVIEWSAEGWYPARATAIIAR